MLAILFFVLFVFSSRVSAAIRNVTIGLTDPALSFAPGWKFSQRSASGGLFLFTDTNGPVLTVSLPDSASSLSYISLKRTGGSLYGVCVDCNGTLMTVFSGHDNHLANNALAVPTTIFTLALDPSQQHTLGITNIPDPSFNDASELTFIEIIVSVQDATSSGVTTSTIAPTSSSTSLTSSISSSSSTTQNTASATANPASPDDNSATTKALIAVVVVLPLFAVLSLVIGLFFYLRNRGRRRDSPSSPSIPAGEVSSMNMPSTMTTRFPSPELGPLAAAGRTRPLVRQVDPFADGLDVPLDGSIAIYPLRRPLSRIVV